MKRVIMFLAAVSSSALVAAQSRPLGTQSLNPDVSAIVDMFYQNDNSKEGISHLHEEINGFGHVHAEAEDEHHHHHGAEEGFNLRHLELQFSADVDPYFRGSAIAAIDLEGAELETAEIETTALPLGLKVKGGKFYSNFGYINAQHSHQWDFTDQPLVYELLLGSHGLNDKGVQLSWLAPTPFYLLAGVESFQGANEKMFDYHGDGPLPRHEGPRVAAGWLKAGPSLPGGHGLQLGVFGVNGKHQEEHDGDEDGTLDHWLDGDNRLYGFDGVYKFNSPKPYGQGDVFLQAEYAFRDKDLTVVQHDLNPAVVGNSLEVKQDGYYAQAGYGFLPRWRAAARWEEVGLNNQTKGPDGSVTDYSSSRRASAMVDFTPTEFSRLRLQLNRGSYSLPEGRENATTVFVQWMVSIGAHGAHSF